MDTVEFRGDIHDLMRELARPFEPDEHGFVGNNPYILKTSITRRLNRIAPGEWSLGRPEFIGIENDLVMVTGPLTIWGMTHWGMGTGKIQRYRKARDKNGKALPDREINALELAQETSKAIKGAANDILTRAGLLFDIGWYMRDIPPGWKERMSARVGFNEYLGFVNQVFASRFGNVEQSLKQLEHSQPGAGAQPPTVLDPKTGEKVPADDPPITPGALWKATQHLWNNRKHFDASLEKHKAELSGLTLSHGVAFFKALHWNYDPEQVEYINQFAREQLGLDAAAILNGLSIANKKEIKGWKDWDGGDIWHGIAALVARAANYDPPQVDMLVAKHKLAQDIQDEAVHYCAARDVSV